MYNDEPVVHFPEYYVAIQTRLDNNEIFSTVSRMLPIQSVNFRPTAQGLENVLMGVVAEMKALNQRVDSAFIISCIALGGD